MPIWAQIMLTVIGSVMASSGFWVLIEKLTEKKDARTKMIIGLGHDRIMELGMQYINRGWITRDEYENLTVYLYQPYKALKGNGSATRIMAEIDKLPIRDNDYGLEV